MAVVKKLKLTGVPYKIFKNTAFVKDMFSSSLEVSKFEGAVIRTVSGIRGQVKKALTAGATKGEAGQHKGDFRATFEDKLLRSDIVVLKAWVPVEVPHLYNPVTSLLGTSAAARAPGGGGGSAPADPEESGWVAMRTHGEVRAERSMPVPALRDSVYRKIEREPRRFNPLKIPASLQAALPFKSKPKLTAKQGRRSVEARRPLVVEPEEKKVGTFLQQLQTLRNAKEAKAKARNTEKLALRSKKLAKEEAAKEKATKEHRKRRYRREGIEVEIKAKIAKSNPGKGSHDD
mmetsp:Transcript_46016/g.106129  ORF Transcript_46016/g.106129 Transcript_46016/m.106129 type:complete len:289 (-) Transcript_46016:118-984(-)